MTNHACDLVVIGSGPGGYVAAIRAAQLGMKTMIVERDALGGVCLNWGCIPTKALLRTSEIYTNMKHASEFGLKAENIGFDIEAVVKRSRQVAGKLSGGIGYLMKKNKITVIEGDGNGWPRAAAGAARQSQNEGWRRHGDRETRHPRHRRAGADHPGGRAGARRQASSGPRKKRWSPTSCRSRCWSSAPAPSALSSRVFIMRSAQR